MKKIIIAVFCILSLNVAIASDTAYINAMKENIKTIGQAKTLQEFQEVANAFERISKMATREWLPVYYTGLMYINMSRMEKDATLREQFLEKARPFVDKTLELAPKESESFILEGYWTTAKLTIDPAGRGQTLGPKAAELFKQAATLDPENPRAYLMQGYSEHGRAQFFGSSTEGSCALFKKSLALFEKKPASEIAPDWGKEGAVYMAGQCK